MGYKIKNIPEKELKKFYSSDLIKRFKDEDRVESFFWQKDATLPVKTKKGNQLMLWGNKEEAVKLPKTGWAKNESLALGKWDYLNPEMVEVPIDSGREKKVWFDMPAGAKGIVVKRGKEERVYLITEDASKEYRRETGHDREPMGEKENYQEKSED